MESQLLCQSNFHEEHREDSGKQVCGYTEDEFGISGLRQSSHQRLHTQLGQLYVYTSKQLYTTQGQQKHRDTVYIKDFGLKIYILFCN